MDNYKEFMGLKSLVITDADHILNEVLGMVKNGLLKNFELADTFSTIDDLLKAITKIRPEYGFLEDWFNKEGMLYINQIDCSLPQDNDDILDFLEYQKFIIENDDQSIRGLIFFLTEFFKEAATAVSKLPIMEIYIPVTSKVSFSSGFNQIESKEMNKWIYISKHNNKSPVEITTGLLLQA